jgi:hypothetical protein
MRAVLLRALDVEAKIGKRSERVGRVYANRLNIGPAPRSVYVPPSAM